MLSEHRDEAGATEFLARAIGNNGWPDKLVVDKGGTNLAGLENLNWPLLSRGWFWVIDIFQVKFLNSNTEQDHRFIKKPTRPMKGFKSFRSASATLAGIEAAHMIHKGQFAMPGKSAFRQFADLAA